jgi:hypothetical protein
MDSAKELEELGFSNERSDVPGGWRLAGVSCDKVMAPVSGQESDPAQTTANALSSKYSGRFNGGTHQ